MGARESGGKVRQWKVRRDLPNCKALYIPGGCLAGFLNHQTVSVQPVSPPSAVDRPHLIFHQRCEIAGIHLKRIPIGRFFMCPMDDSIVRDGSFGAPPKKNRGKH